MSKSELNGFDIDKWNQYGLPEGEKRSTCPKCSHTRKKKDEKCLLLDWDRGLGTCIHCSEVIQLHTYKRKGVSKEYVKPEPIEKDIELPESVIKYFEGRKINVDTLKSLRVGSSKEFMPNRKGEVTAIRYNYFLHGELINIKYKDAKKNFKMYKGAEKVFYNIDSTIGSDYIVITEGEEDCLSVYQSGLTSCISVPNGATIGHNNLDYLDSCIEFFEDKEKIYLATDNDEAGKSLRSELIRRLGAEICYLVDFEDCKDANAYLVKYGEEALRNAIHAAKPVPLENVSTLKDHEEELIDFFQNGFKKGYTIGVENFDKVFSTYTKQFIVITARPSVGKSLWVNQMCMGYNMNYGWKVAFASPESKPTYLHSSNLIRMAFGRTPNSDDINTDKWKECRDYVNDNFFNIELDSFDLDSVLSKADELVKRKGIRVLVIDPLNKIRDKSKSSRTEDDYVVDYASKVESWANRHDALVLLVAHPIKMYPEEGTGKYKMPTFNHIRGSEWWDVSPHGLALNRNKGEDITELEVLKVKQQNLGENGAICYFKWDKDSTRFIPHNPYSIDSLPFKPVQYQSDEDDTPF